MKQTKQFLRPLLMAIVMLVGMLVPQGAWAQNRLIVNGNNSGDYEFDGNGEVTLETQGPIIMTYLSGTSGIGNGEGAASLIDGDDATKWCSNWNAANKPYIIFKTNIRAKLTDYNMVHGNDTPNYPGRAWATWTIYGANFDSDSQATVESTAWKEVDKHSGYSYGSNYSFSNLASLQYQYYKIVVDEVPNNSLQQMAEIHFTFFACNHKGTFTEHPATEATAEAHGNAAAYKMCDICGACLDADGQEIAASVIHYFDDKHTHAAQDPSCTQVGNIAYKECAVCQAIFDLDGNPIDSYEVPMSDHSYDSEGKCITCDQKLPLLSLGSNTIDIEKVEKGYTIFYFRAPQDATYIFETTGNQDTYGVLSTDGEIIIDQDDDSGDGNNFKLSYEMLAGSIVMLGVKQYNNNAIPGYTLVIREHNHEWRDGVCADCYKICDHSDNEDLGHSDATCTQPAGTSCKCNICSFTEFTPDPESSALGHHIVDGVCTRCEKPVAIAVTIGNDTHQFIDFDEALPVALDAPSETVVTLLTDVTLPKDKKLYFDRGNITLDLNGKKISGNGIRIVYLAGGNLTITDNTADKKGVIENTTNGGDGRSSAVVWVDKGALVIHAGTFCSKSELALFVNPINQADINATIDGGRFVSSESTVAISTVGKSALAEGYAYYKTGKYEEIEEQPDTPIRENDITVLPMSTKAIVTVGETTTGYTDIQEAFNAAMAVTGEVTVKLLADVTLTEGENNLARDYYNDRKEEVILTLDLNGHNVTGNYSQAGIPVTSITLNITDSSEGKTGSINCCELLVTKSDIYVAEGVTLRAEEWDVVLVDLQSDCYLENHGILYGKVANFTETFKNYGSVAYAPNDGGDFYNWGSFIPIWKWWGTDWETDEIYCEVYINNEKLYSSKDGNVELSSEVTKAPTCTEWGERTYTAAIEYEDKTYTDTYTVEIANDPNTHSFTNQSIPAEDDECYYYCICDGCGAVDRSRRFVKMFGELCEVTGDAMPTKTITLTKVGSKYYTSLYADFNYTLSEGVEAYYVSSVSDGELTLTKIEENEKPMDTGVVLIGSTGECTLTYSKSAWSLQSANKLKGTSIAIEVQEPYLYAFGLSDTGYIGFWNWENMTIPAWKAYLDYDYVQHFEARGFRMVFEDGTTAIEQVPAKASAAEGSYDLMGRKVNKVKGLGIVNGKKVYVPRK